MNLTQTGAAIWLSTLTVLTGLAVSCSKSTPVTPTPPQLQATTSSDPTSIVQVDRSAGVITITPSPFTAGRERGIVAEIKCQAPSNTILARLNTALNTAQVYDAQKLIDIDLAAYDNANPLRVALIQKDQFQSIQKQYQVQIKAAGPVRFEAFPVGKDTLKLGSFTSQNAVRLPVSNLYTGHPGSVTIRATSVSDKSSIDVDEIDSGRLSQGNNEDYIVVLLYKLLTLPKPMIYTLEARTADGQKFVPPLVISIAN